MKPTDAFRPPRLSSPAPAAAKRRRARAMMLFCGAFTRHFMPGYPNPTRLRRSMGRKPSWEACSACEKRGKKTQENPRDEAEKLSLECRRPRRQRHAEGTEGTKGTQGTEGTQGTKGNFNPSSRLSPLSRPSPSKNKSIIYIYSLNAI